ncbi:MAG: DUF4886 domain-containing protein [Aristaeellaceae bacterium]
MRILAIGNSFSQDATAMLEPVLAASGVSAEVVNLYIGGCPLEKHWQNIEQDAPAYEEQRLGEATGRMLSIREAVEAGPWDWIVTQQASHDSGWENTYEPFLTLLTAWLRERAPGARLALQETWAYERDSNHDRFMRYHRDQGEMYARLSRCYREAAARHGLTLIPCGDVIQALRAEEPFQYEKGGLSLCRDGFHMSGLYGRYALALCWARQLAGIAAADNACVPRDAFSPAAQAEPALLHLIRHTVDRLVQPL